MMFLKLIHTLYAGKGQHPAGISLPKLALSRAQGSKRSSFDQIICVG